MNGHIALDPSRDPGELRNDRLRGLHIPTPIRHAFPRTGEAEAQVSAGVPITIDIIHQSNLGKAIGLGCLLATFSLMFASIAQDAFTPVKVNETFWTLVGLGASAYSIEFSKGSDEPLPHKIEGTS